MPSGTIKNAPWIRVAAASAPRIPAAAMLPRRTATKAQTVVARNSASEYGAISV